MKILHIGKYYPPYSGGIENFMGDLLPRLITDTSSNNSHQICALVHHHEFAHGIQEEVIDQIRIVRVPSYGRLLYAPISPTFGYYLNREVKQFRPDLIHIHMPNTSAFWLLLLAKARNIPWVIHWHSDVVSEQLSWLFAAAYKIYAPFEQSLLRKSQRIISTSPHYLHSSKALKPWTEKTHIIPLGLSQQQMTLTQQCLQDTEQKWEKNKFRLLSIGRLTYYKGHQYLIRAMKNLPDCHLIIVGQGEEEKHLKKLIHSLKLEDKVFLSGKLSGKSLHALLHSCDLFCLPSIERTEAFGLVLLEAMQYAKPTLVSNISGSGMTWVSQDGETGVFANPSDPDDIQSKIQKLKDNPVALKRLGKNGKQRLESTFSMDKVAAETLQLYHDIF